MTTPEIKDKAKARLDEVRRQLDLINGSPEHKAFIDMMKNLGITSLDLLVAASKEIDDNIGAYESGEIDAAELGRRLEKWGPPTI